MYIQQQKILFSTLRWFNLSPSLPLCLPCTINSFTLIQMERLKSSNQFFVCSWWHSTRSNKVKSLHVIRSMRSTMSTIYCVSANIYAFPLKWKRNGLSGNVRECVSKVIRETVKKRAIANCFIAEKFSFCKTRQQLQSQFAVGSRLKQLIKCNVSN